MRHPQSTPPPPPSAPCFQLQLLGGPAERSAAEVRLRTAAAQRYGPLKDARLAEADRRALDYLSQSGCDGPMLVQQVAVFTGTAQQMCLTRLASQGLAGSVKAQAAQPALCAG